MGKKRNGHYGHSYNRMRSELIEAAQICAICGLDLDKRAHYLNPAAPQIDYVIPVSRGGSHTRENARVVHRLCNMKKWAHTKPNETPDAHPAEHRASRWIYDAEP